MLFARRGRSLVWLVSLVACAPRSEPGGSTNESGSTSDALGSGTSSGTDTTDTTGGSPPGRGCSLHAPYLQGGSTGEWSSTGPTNIDLGVPEFDRETAAAQICDSVLGCDCTAHPYADKDACVAAMLAELAQAEKVAIDHGLEFDERCFAKLAVTYPTLNCAEPTLLERYQHLCPVVCGWGDYGDACTLYPGGHDCKPGRECVMGICLAWYERNDNCNHPGQSYECEAGMWCSRDYICEPLPQSGEHCGSYECGPGLICGEICAAGLECVDWICEDPFLPDIGDPCDTCCADGLYCTAEGSCSPALKDGAACEPGLVPTCGQEQCAGGFVCDEVLARCVGGQPGDPCDASTACAASNECKDGVCAPAEPYVCRDDVRLPWL